jgi:hypothetical protein
MASVFLLCAIVGGTVMLLQLSMAIFGIGGHHGDASGCGSMDAGGHVGDLGGSHGHLTGGDHGTAHDSVHDSSHDSQHDSKVDDRTSDHGSLWIFKLISFQTLAAAIAFFGIGGRAALAAEFDPANGTTSTASFLQNMARTMPPMMQVLKEIGGVELPESLIKFSDVEAATPSRNGEPAVSSATTGS